MNATADTPETTRRPYAKTEQVLTTITPDTLVELDARAVSDNVSRAQLIRTFIVDGLDRRAMLDGQVDAARAAGVVDLAHDR